MQLNYEISTVLFFYAIAIVVGLSALIARDFLNGKIELISYRNAILGGLIIFNGLSTLGLSIERKPYDLVSLEDAFRFMAYSILFILIYCLSYLYLPSIKSAGRLLLRHPVTAENTNLTRLMYVAVGLTIYRYTLGPYLPLPFVAQAMDAISQASAGFAALLAFFIWRSRRGKVATGIYILPVISICITAAIISGGGRRILLAVVIAVAVALYWSKRKDFSLDRKYQLLIRTGFAMLFTFIVLAGYNKIRHFEAKNVRSESQNVLARLDNLRRIPTAIASLPEDLQNGNLISATGQDATSCSLLLIRMAKTPSRSLRGRFEIPSPFASAIYAAANPIPRQLWEEKPLPLGYMLPIVAMGTSSLNLGPGIVGHCVYEGGNVGGLFFIAFYALLLAVLTKTLDTYLAIRRRDLLHLGLFASLFPNMLTAARGDLGSVLATYLFSLLAYFVLSMIAAFFELLNPGSNKIPHPQVHQRLEPRRLRSTYNRRTNVIS